MEAQGCIPFCYHESSIELLEERILIGTAMPDSTHVRPAAEQNLGEVKRRGGLPRSDRIASGMPDVGRCL